VSERQPDYFTDGETWDREVYGRLQQSRTRAWIIAAVSAALALLSLLALVLVLPLKEFAPYLVTLDTQTGHLEVTQGLKPGDLSEDEAVTMANLVQYVIARETYDPADLKEHFRTVTLHSDDTALADYRALYDRSNLERPTERYAYHSTVEVTIKNVSFLNQHTAAVRYHTDTQAGERDANREHWIAIMSFKYVQSPSRLQDRFENPLGFKVTSYRSDQEILSK